MSRRPHPSVSIVVSDISYDAAETALDELAKLEDFQQTHEESRFEKRKHNGDTEIDGYIKRELDYLNTFTISPSYTAKDNSLEVEYIGSRTEQTDNFKEIITVFETVIYPLLEEYLTDVPEPKVLSKSI